MKPKQYFTKDDGDTNEVTIKFFMYLKWFKFKSREPHCPFFEGFCGFPDDDDNDDVDYSGYGNIKLKYDTSF